MSTQPPASQPEKQTTTASSSNSDYTPNPSASLPLNPPRQALLDDILALYSCKPSVDRVKRYTPDCIYDDPFGYADNRYKVAGQWFALPKLFSTSENAGYEVVRSDNEILQFKSEQKWTFRLLPKTVTLKSLVTLSLEPESVRAGDFLRIKYHKDQNSEKGLSHEGIWFTIKKWQADNMPKWTDIPELKQFEQDNKVNPTGGQK
ncbi:hypothetical protein E4U56_004281 [Claviceps arundinis]|uniref:Uncharacterized protein n=1 Tax=Claviceps arundinis TaxID=1623583 RepID=A0A9P7STG2_9HYPO|nr:hypothetical protein E4U56_004281 [Claviceps arundinis]